MIYLPRSEVPEGSGGASELSLVGLDNQVTYCLFVLLFFFLPLSFSFFLLWKKRKSVLMHTTF